MNLPDNPKILRMYDRLMAECHRLEIETDLLTEAIDWAAVKHRSQTRKDVDRTPYIIRPIGVCLILVQETEVRNHEVLIAAILHDVLEDTQTTVEEMTVEFGNTITEIVREVTNPKGLKSADAKEWQISHAPSMSQEARLVKLADRLYNLRDMHPPPACWDQAKINIYLDCSRRLVDSIRGTHLTLESLIERELSD